MLSKCDTGKALHHKWAMEVLKASYTTWEQVFWGAREYDAHVKACPQCHAYHVEQELARELRIKAQATQETKNVRPKHTVQRPVDYIPEPGTLSETNPTLVQPAKEPAYPIVGAAT